MSSSNSPLASRSPAAPSTILFATDFSLRAKYGLISSIHLASIFKAKLILCHVHGPLSWNDMPLDVISEENYVNERHLEQKELLHRSLKELGKLDMWIKKEFPGVTCVTHYEESANVSATLAHIVAKKNVDLMVFTSKVHGGDSPQQLFSGRVIQSLKVDIPVLIIPVENAWLGKSLSEWNWKLESIVFAVKMGKNGSIDCPNELKTLEAWKHKARKKIRCLEVLHVSKKETQFDAAEHQEYPLVNQFSVLQSHASNSTDIVEKIIQHVKIREASVLAVTKKKRSFFTSLLHKSFTNAISNDIAIPVLVFHQN